MKKHIEEYLLSFNLQQAANLKNNCWPINPECVLPVHHKNYFVFRCFEHPQFPNVSDIKNRPIASKQTLYLSVYNWLSESFPKYGVRPCYKFMRQWAYFRVDLLKLKIRDKVKKVQKSKHSSQLKRITHKPGNYDKISKDSLT